MIPLEIPIALGREEARRQLEAELAKPEYFDTESWWQRFIDWLTGATETGHVTSPPLVPTIVAGVVVLALVALILLAGPLRRERRVTAEGDMFAGVDATATQLRAEAARLGQTGAWTQAVIQLFRALIRSLGERGVIDESPGMTAHEAAGRGGERLPAFRAALDDAASTFDGLAYGTWTGTRAQYERLVELDAQVARARPVLGGDAAAEPGWVPGTRVTTDGAGAVPSESDEGRPPSNPRPTFDSQGRGGSYLGGSSGDGASEAPGTRAATVGAGPTPPGEVSP